MSNLGSLNILLSLDSIQFNQALNKSSYQSQKFTKQLELNFTKAQEKARQFSERTTQYLNNIEKAANTINKTTGRTFWASVAGWGGSHLSAGVSDVIKYADSYTELRNRIALVTNSQREQIVAMDDVYNISMKTNQALGATTQIYQRFAQNADRLNLSQTQVAELTETVAKSVAISGASAGAAEAALMQFGQALGSAELRGDELNSVIEQTPGLADAIAKGLGVATGELKNLAKSGELNIQKVIQALQKARDSVDNDFGKRLKTVSGAFTNLETETTRYIGALNSAYDVTGELASGIEFAAEHLEQMVRIATLVGGSAVLGVLGKYAQNMAITAINTAKSTVEHIKESKALYEKAQANRVFAQSVMASLSAQFQLAQSEQSRHALREQMKVQSAQIIALTQQEAAAKRELITVNNLAAKATNLLKGALGLIGGPTGAAFITAGALFYFGQQAKEARAAALDMTDVNNQLAESYDKLSEAALSLKITEQLDKIKDQYKEIEKLQAEMSSRQIGADFDGFQVGGGLDEKEVNEFLNKISVAQEKAEKMKQVVDNMLSSMGQGFLRSGKNVEELKEKFRLLGIDGETADRVIAGLQNNLDKVGQSAGEASDKTLDLSEAMKKLNDKSTTLAQKLEVAKLKQQGQAKSAYVLAGLYELLGKEGAQYNEVLIGIATGTITAANAADKAVGLSVETLNKILEGKALLEKNFANDSAITTIETNIKGSKSSENSRDSWLSFYDEIRKKSSSSLGEIELEQARMFQRLEEHNKKGVVSHQEYETAKTAITERFARQRLELAGKYAPEKLLSANLKDELSAIEELKKAGGLTAGEAQTAALQLKFDYAQNRAQNAVNPLDQLRALYDPQQELANQQAQELAQLQAFNEQKLITEEEFQQRRQEIIDKYKNNEFQQDMANYATGLNDLGTAFDGLASMVEQSAGKQSAAYKAMFAISKAFAIAEATVKLSQAIAQAMADPSALTPAQKFANMAAVASAGVNLISQITSVAAFATGGHVQGPGTGTSDSIPAWLSNNEFVMTSRTVDHYGVAFMNALNQRRLPRFASGGRVGGGGSPSYPGISSNGGEGDHNEISITINIAKDGKEDVTVEQQIAQSKALSDAITVKVLEVMRKQRGRDGGLLN